MKMREIKFRAWDGDRMQNVLTLGLYEGFVDTNKLHSDIEDFKLMQYTGLKDKNGREIYEGDIISWKERVFLLGTDLDETVTERLPVEFEEGCFMAASQFLFALNHKVEVIGNIYENPELLEASK